jgi:hypothetical protein
LFPNGLIALGVLAKREYRRLKKTVALVTGLLAFLWLCGASQIQGAKYGASAYAPARCEDPSAMSCSLSGGSSNEPAFQLIKLEIEKVNKEIDANHESGGSSFQYRFGLVGGVLAGMFYVLKKETERNLSELLRDRRVVIALAFACVISIAIDAHVRASIVATDYIAQWIYRYAEPTVLHGHLGCCPYEAFLRMPDGNGMHTDSWYRYLFWPHLQLFTAVLYILYLFVLHESAVAHGEDNEVVTLSFVLVHVALIILTFSAHYAPGGWGTRAYWPFPDDTAVLALPNILCRGLPIVLVGTWIGMDRLALPPSTPPAVLPSLSPSTPPSAPPSLPPSTPPSLLASVRPLPALRQGAGAQGRLRRRRTSS